MNTTYILFLLTFLLFPIIAIVTYQFTRFQKINKPIKLCLALLLVYDTLFLFGISFKGDYADYIMFSMQYLIICLGLCLSPTGILRRVAVIAARVLLILGVIIGLIGIFIFTVVSHDYEADKFFNFKSDGAFYETRRYSFGFVTLEDTKYTFDTYREYKYLPFEKKVDKSIFFDTKTNVEIYEDSLRIYIDTKENKRRLIFKDGKGNEFSKLLK